jgi:hypothetical protein
VNCVEPVIQVDLIDLSDVMRDGKLTIAPGLVFSPEPYLQIKFEYDFVLEHAAGGGYKRNEIKNDTACLSIVVEF